MKGGQLLPVAYAYKTSICEICTECNGAISFSFLVSVTCLCDIKYNRYNEFTCLLIVGLHFRCSDAILNRRMSFVVVTHLRTKLLSLFCLN